MQIEGIDFVPDENLQNKGELQPLIDALKAAQKHQPKKDEEFSLEDIDESQKMTNNLT